MPVNSASARIICFAPFCPAIFTLMTVFNSSFLSLPSNLFSVNLPVNSQSVLFVNMIFTVLGSTVLESLDIVPLPSSPPIFIKVFIAGTAGLEFFHEMRLVL